MNIKTIRPNEQGCIIYEIESNGDSTICKLWIDVNETIWIESNDGTQICIPETIKEFIAKKIKTLYYGE